MESHLPSVGVESRMGGGGGMRVGEAAGRGGVWGERCIRIEKSSKKC